MVWRQALLIVGLLTIAVVVEVTLLSRLGLPGATPDLVAVTVIALALALGSTRGAVAGFVAGVLLDLAPPATTPMGVNAVILMAVGYLAGYVVDARDRTVPVLLALVAVSVGGVTLVTGIVDGVLGVDAVDWNQLPVLTFTAAIYGAALAPAVLPAVSWLVRRVTPDLLVG